MQIRPPEKEESSMQRREEENCILYIVYVLEIHNTSRICSRPFLFVVNGLSVELNERKKCTRI